MTAPPTSLRERKKRKTRQALIDNGMRLFAEQGFEATTVDQIAELTEVSQRTFFRYFPAKEAVVFSEHERRIGIFRELLARHGERCGPAEKVRRTLRDFAEEYQRNRARLLAEYRIVVGSPVLIARDVELDIEFEEAIAEALGAGRKRNAAAARRARILAGAVFGAVRAVMQLWFEKGCRPRLADLGQEGLQIIDASLEPFK
jgi:AcrR family transcriptional regulator